jgi:hypothetical protein
MIEDAVDTVITTLEQTLRSSGARAAIDQLIDHLDRAGEYRSLLDALLLKARHELGLPLFHFGSLSSLPEPARTQFEEQYVQAIRLVGSRFLDKGEIPTAWAYFRAIAEPAPVATALEQYLPDEDAEKLGQVIDVAFNQGANPRRGFELILDHYGTCSAITALEQVPPGDPAVQVACVERLIRHLHDQLAANLRADIRQHGEVVDETASITRLMEGRDWLFADEAYHTDISHLSATVRYSILVPDPAVLALAAELADYGRRLSPRLQFEGAPPFERTFDDHLIYLQALLGREQDAAIAHFQHKLGTNLHSDAEASLPAQVLVNLLARIGRPDLALDLACARLDHLPDAALACPGIAELCQRAGRPDRLESIARQQANLVNFLAARLQQSRLP